RMIGDSDHSSRVCDVRGDFDQEAPMSLQLDPNDPWVKRGYGQASIEPGERPAVITIDLQYAFTDPNFIFGGAELIERATQNAAEVLHAARAAGVPVFHTVVAWKNEKDLGLWK